VTRNPLNLTVGALGLAYAALGLHQLLTGRVVAIQRSRHPLDPHKVSLGGWLAVGVGLTVAGTAFTGPDDGAVAAGVTGFAIVLLAAAGLWGAMRLGRRSRSRR
jgi:hypothetical protein